MADMFSRKQRSEIMSKVKSRGNRATELRLANIFRDHSITGWRRHYLVFGRPDFAFRTERVAVFVDGCFWHRCPKHGALPVNNRAFWARKLSLNRQRDKIVAKTLRCSGWLVLRIWQHELREPERVARKVARALARRSCVGA